jgi:DNA-directed RNA polymerase alpha subunit
MAVVPFTMHLPADLWHAVQAVALHDGDANTVILRALQECITASRKRRSRPRSGQHQKLVKQLSRPVVALKLSARPASTLKLLKLRYVYELVQKAPTDFVRLPNFGEKSLREGEERLATLGLTLGMTLDDDAHNTGVVAAVPANIEAARK